jgi:hypothetical protein
MVGRDRRRRGGRRVRAARRPGSRLRLRLAVVPLRRGVRRHRHRRLLLRGQEGIHHVPVAHRHHRPEEAPQQQRLVPAQAGDLQARAVGQISRPPREVGSSARRVDGRPPTPRPPPPYQSPSRQPQDPGLPSRAASAARARSRRAGPRPPALQWTQRQPPTEAATSCCRQDPSLPRRRRALPPNAVQCSSSSSSWLVSLSSFAELVPLLPPLPACLTCCLGVRGWTVEEAGEGV